MEIKQVIEKYKSYGIKLNEPMIRKAIEFAIKYHGEQKRASGEPYYHHPLEVADIIAKMRLDSDSIVTAILHDTIEDTELTLQDIKDNFSDEIAKLVDGVTKLNKIEYKAESTRQTENFRKLLIAMSDDIRVLLIKLADRLHNMRTIEFISKSAKRNRIALETMEIYAPLAERIGLQQIKVELQDICFRILHPEVRESIMNRFAMVRSHKEDFIVKIIAEIQTTLADAKISAEVIGRHKTPYSTWMKMQQKNVELEQLSDIIAFRVIVDDVQECYRVLGIMHSKYKMVPNNFQDFISTPKSNGYQSLHTVVIGPYMQKVEIQIRTKQMHDIAELGVAAHWRYKQNHQNIEDGKKYSWIRELLAILEQDSAHEEFLKNTKMAMYYDQVFCFTPKGNLVALPKGATIVDFAYMVHLNVGNTCIGAKVNGLIVPLSTQLNNGDQIEIITAREASPLPEWQDFVVTGRARSEIRKMIKNQQKEQYIKLGESILQQTLANANVINQPEAIETIAKNLNKDQTTIFLSVGQGHLCPKQITQSLVTKKSKLRSTLELFKLKSFKATDKKNAIAVKGLISGMAVHYPKCCFPLPGDKICGVITPGQGVAIHTLDCPNLIQIKKEHLGQIVHLVWDHDTKDTLFICRLNVVLLNQPSALALVTAEIARDGGNIINFKITERHTKYFHLTFDIEVESTLHMEKIINTLRTVKVVQSLSKLKD